MNSSDPLPDPSDGPRFCAYVKSLPYDKRWDALRPVLEPLFHTESLKDIAKMMLDRYQFYANESQYKYRFGKVWKLKKNIPQVVKEAALRKGKQRAKEGKQSVAKYRGRAIPASRFHIANSITPLISSLSLRDLFTFPLDTLDMFGRYAPFGNNILLAWSLPFGAQPSTRHVLSPHHDSPSPYNTQLGNTPADLEMTTPSEHVQSPTDSLFTTMADSASLTPVISQQRLSLFLQGKLPELFQALSQQERADLSKYLSHFWHFCFASAQGWSPYSTPNITQTSSAMDVEMENTHPTVVASRSPTLVSCQSQNLSCVIPPSQACGWAIHVHDLTRLLSIKWTSCNTTPPPNHPNNKTGALNDEMRAALENSCFSKIPSANLAVPLSGLVKEVSHDENDLLSEAICFAIMGRNRDLLHELFSKVDSAILELGFGRSPSANQLQQLFTDMAINFTQLLHLATSYLDGSTTCCLIIEELARQVFEYPHGLGDLRNVNGHTLIDSVLLTILKSHSKTPLNVVDPQLSRTARYSGQEVDICGRWSATSTCFKSLVNSGEVEIPWLWKHKFCRTSTQVVCHSLNILLRCIPLLKGQDSGLFSIRCTNPQCGQLFTLSPLHAVAITGFHLIKYGSQEEDLFGMLACYLCLIDGGVDPLVRKECSASQLLGVMNDETCSHPLQTAAEFAHEILDIISSWDVSKSCLTGFAVLLAVMDETEKAVKDIRQLEHQIKNNYSDLVSDLGNPTGLWVFNDSSLEIGPEEYDSDIESILEEQSPKRTQLGRSFRVMCQDGNSNDSICNHHIAENDNPSFANSSKLGHIWAAIQAELNSSERRGIDEQHLSSSFDMQRLLSSLGKDVKPDIGHLRNQVLQDYCRCGKFAGAPLQLATREDAFKDPSLGLGDDTDLWSRISFIENPDLFDLL